MRKISVIAIHTHGDAAKRRQPSVHQATPFPAAAVTGDRGAALAGPGKPALGSERGGVGSAMGFAFLDEELPTLARRGGRT